jgi:hypothetical protein
MVRQGIADLPTVVARANTQLSALNACSATCLLRADVAVELHGLVDTQHRQLAEARAELSVHRLQSAANAAISQQLLPAVAARAAALTASAMVQQGAGGASSMAGSASGTPAPALALPWNMTQQQTTSSVPLLTNGSPQGAMSGIAVMHSGSKPAEPGERARLSAIKNAIQDILLSSASHATKQQGSAQVSMQMQGAGDGYVVVTRTGGPASNGPSASASNAGQDELTSLRREVSWMDCARWAAGSARRGQTKVHQD